MNLILFGDDKNRSTNSHEKKRLHDNSIVFSIMCGTVLDSRSLRVRLLLVAISNGTRKNGCVARTNEIMDEASTKTDIQKNI